MDKKEVKQVFPEGRAQRILSLSRFKKAVSKASCNKKAMAVPPPDPWVMPTSEPSQTAEELEKEKKEFEELEKAKQKAQEQQAQQQQERAENEKEMVEKTAERSEEVAQKEEGLREQADERAEEQTKQQIAGMEKQAAAEAEQQKAEASAAAAGRSGSFGARAKAAGAAGMAGAAGAAKATGAAAASAGRKVAGAAGAAGAKLKEKFIPGVSGEGKKESWLGRSWLGQTWKNGPLGKILIFLILFGIGGLVFFSATLIGVGSPVAALAGYVGGGVSGGGTQGGGGATKATLGGQGFLSKAVSDFQATYKKSMAEATGKSIEGTVEKNVGFVGIEIKDPYIKNPSRVNQDEQFETSARIKGFHPKKDISITVACHLMSRDLSLKAAINDIGGKDKVGSNVREYAGTPQKLTPDTIKADNFDQEITCYPKPNKCGDYKVTISAQATDLTTDSVLNNYIINKEYMQNELREYAKSKEKELGSQGAVESALRELHPEIEDWKSISEKGPISVFMLTEKSPLIGIDDKSQIKFKIAVENALAGWLRSLDSVTVIIPTGLTPVAEYCPNWQVSGDRMTLPASYLKSKETSLKELKRGMQLPLSTCHFQYSGPVDEIIGTAKRITFLASVKYKYVVQKEYNVEVRTSTGLRCPKEKPTTVQSGSVGGTGTKTSNTEAQVKAMNEAAEKKYGKPGDNLETIPFFGNSISLNKALKDPLKAVETGINKYCTKDIAYMKSVNYEGYADVQHIPYTKYKAPQAYGVLLIVDRAGNPDAQTSKTIKTKLPTCVIAQFKNNGFLWGGDAGPPYRPSNFQYKI